VGPDDLLPALLAAHQPDAVLIALGTNDLSTQSSDQVVADLKTLHDQVARFSLANRAHPVPYLATIPPVYPRLETGLEPKITAVNVALRRSMPENVVDFDSWMPPDWEPGIMSWEGDGVHLGCLGHRRRAEVLEVMAGN
jgi:lysophospholipase L1-like esterase